MKALGVVRRLDELGRIVIPKEIRKTNGWECGTPMEMFMDKQGLFIRPYGDYCAVCGSRDELMKVKDKHICTDCCYEAVKV